MKWAILIVVLFLAGVAIIGYSIFAIGGLSSCDATCQKAIMPAYFVTYNSWFNIGYLLWIGAGAILFWRAIARWKSNET